ncbi:MAG: VOC family protein [Rhizobiales bacterium]|nr:VOC family protein [Hyphomicrobiales bacterium]
MEKVEGIGGLFFSAKDPKALAEWYETHLGINLAPKNVEMTPWTSKEGVTIFAPFDKDTDYFPADRQFMFNFRVSNLNAMLSQLKQAKIEIINQQTMDGIGSFARINDPEGNPIELWQPQQ